MHKYNIERDENHIYRIDGEITPGVTEVLSPLGSFDMLRPGIIEPAQEFGKITHDTIHLYDTNNLAEFDPALQPWMDAWERCKQEHKIKILHSEPMYHSRIYRFCGEPDKVVLIDGCPAIIDLKTGLPAPYVGLQLAGYAILVEENLGILFKKTKRISVYLHGEGKKGYKWQAHTTKTDKQEFLTLLYANNIIRKYKRDSVDMAA